MTRALIRRHALAVILALAVALLLAAAWPAGGVSWFHCFRGGGFVVCVWVR